MIRDRIIHCIGIASVCVLTSTAARGAGEPSFSLAWSEYPSWSAFGVAHEFNIINGKKGKLGPIEEKWGVDIVLKQADYDPCLIMYGAKQTDAVCITNMDVLNPSLTRPSVAILPTSTSHGADACIVTSDITEAKHLKGKKVYGLAKTVSEYCFVRNLEKLGENPTEYNFVNMDPGAAALAMQQKQDKYEAIVVWNPFVLETLNKRKDVRVLFDSTSIPGEIVDMVVVAQESLSKPGGRDFACAIIDAFYEINKRLADPKTRDEALLALGEKFSNLKLQAMRKVVQQTKFYDTPDKAEQLFGSKEFKEVMKTVADFCVKNDIAPKQPKIGYGDKESGENIRFDTQYIEAVAKKRDGEKAASAGVSTQTNGA
jgi:NitT/TauT family transport system substrate-binding protein